MSFLDFASRFSAPDCGRVESAAAAAAADRVVGVAMKCPNSDNSFKIPSVKRACTHHVVVETQSVNDSGIGERKELSQLGGHWIIPVYRW